MNKIVTAGILVILIFIVYPDAGDVHALDFALSGSVNETYDDNITYEKSNQREDFITSLIAALSLNHTGRTSEIDVTARTTQQIFARYFDKFNNNSQDVNLNFTDQLTEYNKLTIKDTFNHTYDPRSFEDEFGKGGGRFSYLLNRSAATFISEINKLIVVNTRYTGEQYLPSRRNRSDSYLNSGGMQVDFNWNSYTMTSIMYDYSNRNFNPGADATVHSPAVLYRQYILNQLYFDLKGGVDFINSYNDQQYTKPFVIFGIHNEIDRNSRFSVTITKQYYPDTYTQDISDNWRVSGIFVQQVGRRILLNLNAFYGRGEYIQRDEKYTLEGIITSISYEMLSNIDISIQYSFTKSEGYYQYLKNSFMMGITGRI